MQRISRAYEKLLDLFKMGAEIVIFLIFLLIVIDVFVRLLKFQPSAYTLGVVEYGLLWFTMLGAPWLVRMKGHVFVDSLVSLLPLTVQYVLAKFVYVVCIVCCLFFIYYSTDLTIAAYLSGELDYRGEAQPLWLLLVPIPVSFTMIAIEFLRFLVGIDTMYTSRTEVRENV
ncbi:MAG: TRAP transporter small permease subunit [Deltaproteobacteria bacterium]|nr:TRAP transporter small permease subunit [Deltaproteobacteria bacterium]MDE0341732.1 TRAP transporter small permease subunit [Deltaproteobacteria bacterium]